MVISFSKEYVSKKKALILNSESFNKTWSKDDATKEQRLKGLLVEELVKDIFRNYKHYSEAEQVFEEDFKYLDIKIDIKSSLWIPYKKLYNPWDILLIAELKEERKIKFQGIISKEKVLKLKSKRYFEGWGRKFVLLEQEDLTPFNTIKEFHNYIKLYKRITKRA